MKFIAWSLSSRTRSCDIFVEAKQRARVGYLILARCICACDMKGHAAV
jgi:hypothetical protein